MFDCMFTMSQKTSSLLRSIESRSNSHFSEQEQNLQQASNHDNIQTSSTPGFLLGVNDYKSLDVTNLPDFVKEHQTTLTFPEKLMLMLIYIDREGPGAGNCAGNHCISWVHDGRAFIIRNKDELVQTFLPIFFRQSKFPSFTRKLYRWGFRQISISQDHVSGSRRQMIFGHEFFQRDNKSLMSRMRSTTAAGTRRAMQAMTLKQRERSEATVKLSIQSKIDEHGGMLSLQHLTPIYPAPERIATTPLSHLNSQYFSIGNLSSTIKFQQNGILQYPCQEGQKTALNVQEPDSAESHQPSSTRIMNKYEDISRTEDSKVGQFLPGNNSEASLLPNVSSTRLQEQVTNVNVENQRDSESDPNAYMRAAVDLLLRYAS